MLIGSRAQRAPRYALPPAANALAKAGNLIKEITDFSICDPFFFARFLPADVRNKGIFYVFLANLLMKKQDNG
jgi:hypothetical protein